MKTGTTAVRRNTIAFAGICFVTTLAWAQAVKPLKEPTDPASRDIVELSPFMVDATKDKGYFAENTLAGSRLNSNLADLGASISVVTKQQLEDTASLDINDVFKYEANTEGSNTYTPLIMDRGTAKDTNAGYTLGNDGGTTTNAQSNRVRGLASADAAINNYPTNSRIPFDSYNTQSVEITRGPNSLLFGLGSPSGIVNQTTAQAALNRNTNEVTLRTDQHGSFRTSLAISRSLVPNKLAVYAAFLYNNQQFQRKPSSDLTRRQYGSLTFKPFRKTVIRASAEGYLNNANRPNSLTPRDFVTPWLASGRPVYDPITRSITVLNTGRVVGPYAFSTASPGYQATINGVAVPANASALTNFNNAYSPNVVTSPLYVPGIGWDGSATRPVQRISGNNEVDYFARQPQIAGVNYRTVWTNPEQALVNVTALGWVAQDPRYAINDRQWTSSTSLPLPTASINGVTYTYGTYNLPGITNASIYDWNKYNTNQANFGKLRAGNYNIELEQEILPNLFFSAGWFRQDIDSIANYTISQLTGATLQIDTNVKKINGQPNTYFGLPFLTDSAPDTFYLPETDDNYRAMLAYDLDLTKQRGWLRHLGRHRLLGMWSKQAVSLAVERWRNVFIDGDANGKLRYLPNNLLNNGFALWSSTTLQRSYYMASPGSPQATVTQSVGAYNNKGWDNPYNTSIEVYNYTTGQFEKVSMTENAVFADNGSYKSYREVKSKNFAAQSYLFNNRLVTTLGIRRDEYRSRRTTTGQLTNDDLSVKEAALTATQIFDPRTGRVASYDRIMNRWNRWDKLSGDTKTYGGALHPLQGWSFIERPASQGSILADFLRGMTLYFNKSDNFNPPATFQTDYFNKPLPKPTGRGRDLGVGFAMFNNKLVARLNWFTTESFNERSAAAGTLLTRAAYGDTTLMRPWAEAVVRLRHGANPSVTTWNTEATNPVSSTAMQQEVWALMQLPVNYYANLGSVTGTQQTEANGAELQLTYNPTSNWTIKVTGSRQATIAKEVAPEFFAWQAVRMPVWTSAKAPEIADFTDGNGTQYSLSNFWTSYGYTSAARLSNTDGNTNAERYYANTVTSQVATAKSLEGVPSPNQRKYRASFLTNYTITQGRFKGVSFGGSERWESKAAVGYFGAALDPLRPTVINTIDIKRPVYLENGNYYTDLWISYRRKIFRDKVGLRLQLNCNNVTEDGHLQPIAVNYDGQPYAFRIIDSRQWLLTATFTF